MGSGFVTKEKAAAILDCHLVTIYKYIKKGYLRTETKGRHILVCEDDLLQFKKAKDEPLPFPVNKITIAQLFARVTVLESYVSVIRRLLNIKYEPLSLTDPEIRNLYLMATEYAINGWPPHAEEMWADTFVRMKMEDLQQLEQVTEDPHPWRPFLRLAASMHTQGYDHKDQFAAGRNNVHVLGSLWCQLKGESVKDFDLMVGKDGVPLKKVMNRMKRQKTP